MTDPRLAERAQRLHRLSQDQAWQELRQLVLERRDKEVQKLARTILTGGEFDQRDIDYQRGVLDGMKAVVDAPEKVGDTLEKALRRDERNK